MIRFDLEYLQNIGITDTNKIDSVKLELYFYSGAPGCPTPNDLCSLYVCTKEWDVNYVTWINAMETIPWDKRGGDYKDEPECKAVCVRVYNWEIYDVTSVIKSFISNPGSNYGFVIIVDEVSDAQGRTYHSSEYAADPTLRPKLTVYYKP